MIYMMFSAVIVIVAFVIGALLGKSQNPKPKSTPRELALAQAMRQCRDKANQYKETDAGLSYEVLDIVGGLEKKELL